LDEHTEDAQDYDGLDGARDGEAKLAELLHFFR